jgi:23S rRNA (adenine2030-N6)-methyltransferase
MTLRPADRGDRLNGSGLIVVNPPWTLESELKLLLPALAERLAHPEARTGRWRLEWLTGEDGSAAPT